MTASTPPRTSSPASPLDATDRAAPQIRGDSTERAAPSPLGRARAVARRLLGRDRPEEKKEDPNIYPLF